MAYAAVVSLKQTIQRFLHPSESRILLPNLEVESIYEEVRYLQTFLESISYFRSSKRIDALERQIKDVVHKAEDLIESHISDRFLSESESFRDESLTLTFSQELFKVKQEITSLTETVKNKEEYNIENQQPSSSSAADAVSSRTGSGGEIKMVGFDDELMKLKYWLLGGSHRLDIIAIVGMAGIGKTTLARKVYCDQTVISTFSCQCFEIIGPKYQLREFLLLVLDQLGFHIDKKHEKKDSELIEDLYKFLKGRRYLIVLDDIWDTQVYDDLKHLFPDDNNRSRIIVTTRLVNVARRAVIKGNILQVPFLNDEQSWNLLHQMVFTTEELCDHQLEKVGKQIAKNCEGLPLAIVAFGNLLSKIEKTAKNWKSVAENENSLFIRRDEYTPIAEALSLSYKQLPQHLKACFLYVGVFPRNYEIPSSKLMKLWVAEGFLEPQKSKSLEDMAEECLDDLVSRSLVLVREWSSRGRTKTCRIHFVFRNLCVSEARNEKLFHVINKLPNSFPEGINRERRLCIHINAVLGLKEVHKSMASVSAARSLLCYGPQHHHGARMFLNYRLLKVLDALKIRFYKFPDEVAKLVQLRYLAITYDGELPASISRLRNLVVLIVRRHQRIKWSDDPVYLPMEIWNLHALRHLECMGFDLRDPSSAAKGNDDGFDNSLILEKLATLSGVSAHSCTEGVLARMPSLMKLGIRIESRHDGVETFSFFGDFTYVHHLESFKCVVVHPNPESQVVSSIPTFYKNLRKITLSGCGFSWEYMSYIGGLQNLEVLKLRCCAFQGPVWELVEGEFLRLKFLLLEDLDIEHWRGNSYHFPLLTRMIIRHCYKLGEIPREFGDIPTLEMIEVDDCTPSVMISARHIHEDQKELGNDDLQVRIHSSWDDKKKLKS